MKIPQKSNGDNDCGFYCALTDDNTTYGEEKFPNYLISTTKTKCWHWSEGYTQRRRKVGCDNNIDYDAENINELNKAMVATTKCVSLQKFWKK